MNQLKRNLIICLFVVSIPIILEISCSDNKPDNVLWNEQPNEKIIFMSKVDSPEGEFFSLKKASVSHMAPQPDNPRYKDRKIDVKSLTDILEINISENLCVAESGVTFVKLVNETLKHGLVPMCVSELKEITIGGAVAGCSVESMSFIHGGFHDSCIEYEVVTGEGEILVCSKERNPEIFEMVHGSFGTLAIITRLDQGAIFVRQVKLPVAVTTNNTFKSIAGRKGIIGVWIGSVWFSLNQIPYIFPVNGIARQFCICQVGKWWHHVNRAEGAS